MNSSDAPVLHHSGIIAEPLEIPTGDSPDLGTGDFSLALWVRSDLDDRVPGDLVSQYDPASRRGFHLTLKSNPGVASSQANWRHLQFGIDDDRATSWRDCGRPGRALMAFSMAAYNGKLYAGTCEPGSGDRGTVYHYAGPDGWISRGSPDQSNAVTALAEFDGSLYAGTGKYRVAGSSLPESENQNLGGGIFRLGSDGAWIACGRLADTEAVGGMVVFNGTLYATSLYRPPGFFRFAGGTQWERLPNPSGPDLKTGEPVPVRPVGLTVHDGFLYATSWDHGCVHRYDGSQWTNCGKVGDNTQTYAFASYEGRLHVATWPSGRVFRFDDVGSWTDIGRLGEELEVMGMLVYNGCLIGGTLPLAEVYAHDGGDRWKLWQRLDHTPDVKYRRAWTMAEHAGEVFCSTLPSGSVHAASRGMQAAWDFAFPMGWHHVAAVKTAAGLALYVDGAKVAEKSSPGADAWQLSNAAPLCLGKGRNGPLNGQLADVRLYQRSLSAEEIQTLAAQRGAWSEDVTAH